jgi:hypothetical protein
MRHPITLVCLKEVGNEVKGALGRWQTSATQSRQSAKRFSSRWNWDSPTPLAAVLCGLQYVSDRGDGYMEKHSDPTEPVGSLSGIFSPDRDDF